MDTVREYITNMPGEYSENVSSEFLQALKTLRADEVRDFQKEFLPIATFLVMHYSEAEFFSVLDELQGSVDRDVFNEIIDYRCEFINGDHPLDVGFDIMFDLPKLLKTIEKYYGSRYNILYYFTYSPLEKIIRSAGIEGIQYIGRTLGSRREHFNMERLRDIYVRIFGDEGIGNGEMEL